MSITSTYYKPLRPRINIYSQTDNTYSSPLYTFNAFTDSGSQSKPISLSCSSTIEGMDAFSLTLENSDDLIDTESFNNGNRVFIEGSKDGVSWQPIFKGLVRSAEDEIFGVNGKNFVINGYSYLVRLKERVVKFVKESAILSDGSYNTADTTMYTNNLVKSIIETASNYLYGPSETSLNFVKTDVLSSSPINDWIPKVEPDNEVLASVIDNILEYSNSVLTFDSTDDRLRLYTPDRRQTGVNAFVITNIVNKTSDDASITMYPRQPYKQGKKYDTSDSASKIISLLPVSARDQKIYESFYDFMTKEATAWEDDWTDQPLLCYRIIPLTNQIKDIKVICRSRSNISSITSFNMQIRNNTTNTSQLNGDVPVVNSIRTTIPLYRDSIQGKAFPSTAGSFVLGMLPSASHTVTADTKYWLVFPQQQSITSHMALVLDTKSGGRVVHLAAETYDSTTDNEYDGRDLRYATDFSSPYGEITPSSSTPPVEYLFVAEDKNATHKLGLRESASNSPPSTIVNVRGMREWILNSMYSTAKPQYQVTYPALTLPDILPKARDIVFHVDTQLKSGTRHYPIQSTVISSVNYDFGQDSNSILGLTTISLTTSGIRKGYY